MKTQKQLAEWVSAPVVGACARTRMLWTSLIAVTLLLTLLSAPHGWQPAQVYAQDPQDTSAPGAESAEIGPQAWVEYPHDGETFALEPLTFDIYATDAGGVARIDVTLNGEALAGDGAQSASADGSTRLVHLAHEWEPTEEGEYVLEARGINAAGASGKACTVTFCVVTCEPVETPTTSATATPTEWIKPTATPTPFIPTSTPTPTPDLPTKTPTPDAAERVFVVPTDTATPTREPAYDLYVRRMDFMQTNPSVGDTVELSVMLASNIAPQGAAFYPASHFRWRQGPNYPWQEVACPDNFQYASCLKNVTFSYAQPGSYVVEVEADSRQTVPETKETNNTKSWTLVVGQRHAPTPTFTPMPGYDLYVRRMDIMQTNPSVGDAIQMAIMLATDTAPQGAAYFPASYLRWRQGPNYPWQEVACPDNFQYASCLKNVTFSYAQPGSYVVEVQADSRQGISEADETNNTRTWTINVGQAQQPPQPPPSGPTDIDFRSDAPYVNAGNCTTLRWDVEGVQAVYLDGQGVTGHGTRDVCPCEPTTYRLEVTKLDGSRETPEVFIDVYGSCETQPPGGETYPPEGQPSSDTSGPDISGVGTSWDGCEFTGHASISDSSGVSWAEFHFRLDDGGWQSWGMSDRGGGYWEMDSSAPTTWSEGGVDYYVVAGDNNGNQSESGTASDTYSCGTGGIEW